MVSYKLFGEAMHQLQTQFEFLRFCLEQVSDNRANEFFKSKKSLDSKRIEGGLNELTKLDEDDLKKLKNKIERGLKMKWGAERQDLYRKQFVPNDLNKSELLLLVALFESYLKDVYEGLVRADPRRAFSKSGKQIELRMLFVDSAGEWSKSKCFQKIVSEEVDRFDHQPFPKRMKFLSASYSFEIDPKHVDLADVFIERRHKISHRWTDRNEVKHVSPRELDAARDVFQTILQKIIKQSMGRYSKDFVY